MAKKTLTKGREIWNAVYERLGLKALVYSVPKHAQTFPYMLGGISFSIFMLLFATGIYLAQYYNPNQLNSNSSIIYLISQVPFGNFIRGVHFWAADIVIILLLVHMIRVFISGSYKKPRELTWVSGVFLLFITFAFLFTGTMMSLRQEGIEALEHNGEIGLLLGKFGTWFTSGFTSNIPLIGRVYVAHITILVLLFIIFIIAHFYLIKVHGLSPEASKNAKVKEGYNEEDKGRFSNHLIKLTGWALIFFALIFILAVIFPASMSSNGVAGIEATKPPWMFLWLYGLEDVFGISSLILGPLLLFVSLAVIPFIDKSKYLNWRKRPWIMVYGALILFVLILLTINAMVAPI